MSVKGRAERTLFFLDFYYYDDDDDDGGREKRDTLDDTRSGAFPRIFSRVVDIFPGVSSSTSTSSCIMNTYRQSMMICAKFSPLSLVFLSLSEPGASFCYVFFFRERLTKGAYYYCNPRVQPTAFLMRTSLKATITIF